MLADMVRKYPILADIVGRYTALRKDQVLAAAAAASTSTTPPIPLSPSSEPTAMNISSDLSSAQSPTPDFNFNNMGQDKEAPSGGV